VRLRCKIDNQAKLADFSSRTLITLQAGCTSNKSWAGEGFSSMASDISIDDQFLWVSNMRLFGLVDLACEVGRQLANGEEEKAYVARLAEFGEGAYPGISFDLAACFPTTGEKKWWARVFHLVARRIFLRTLGNQGDQTWQPSMIGDAYLVARMLTHAVQLNERAWHPSTEDPNETDAYTNGSLRIRS